MLLLLTSLTLLAVHGTKDCISKAPVAKGKPDPCNKWLTMDTCFANGKGKCKWVGILKQTKKFQIKMPKSEMPKSEEESKKAIKFKKRKEPVVSSEIIKALNSATLSDVLIITV